MGENAFLTELDVFLQRREREIGEMLMREGELLAGEAAIGGSA